ncbi:phosphomannomutase/phosphoglucomutase [Candidatus Woesearchaeota archaeon]|jgi:phosphomannomutase|nr:phosphomannomutase/phosphoglucomutase [Candidatus Woesearchaeota archaeon]MBT6041213.1 phosphomannomutase/phosphoglucomutase [Candidatus Woesearchaeota archaeon]MBT6337499.1 phosphomannomutase/phosphoglucomutase [Candidatus Woesearchaeota archaeon]MBT7928188.1 phosphomannomutase/phosphoglucomutase [Candidatus Woesearchaeota archaeon]
MSIFKAYDIRGIYPDQLDEKLAYNVGRSFVTFLNCKQVCVGQDARKTSPELFDALTKGIMDQGADVISIGLCSTPLFYFATKNHDSGIMVTASHNPAEYNGFKLCRDGTVPISGDTGIKEIEKLALAGEFSDPKSKGKLLDHNYLLEFLDFCLKHKGNIKPMKVVVDTANGMGGYVLPKILEQLPQLEIIPLFFDIDMSFPNHEANPLNPDTMKDLQKAVLDNKADLGIAIDGDADRVMFVDERAQLISADFIGALVGLEMLKEKPNLTLGYDVRCSKIVKEVWENAGAKTIITRVGHALIKERMRKENAYFVGEFSGHFYYEETSYVENTILTTLQILNIISEENKPFSEIIQPLRKYFQSGEHNFKVEDKLAKMKELEQVYKEKGALNTHWLDGITVEFENWWFNVRPSNTEPLLRLNLETDTKELLDETFDELKKFIEN